MKNFPPGILIIPGGHALSAAAAVGRAAATPDATVPVAAGIEDEVICAAGGARGSSGEPATWGARALANPKAAAPRPIASPTPPTIPKIIPRRAGVDGEGATTTTAAPGGVRFED